MRIFSSLHTIVVNFVFSTMNAFGALVENKVTRYTSTSLFLDLLLYPLVYVAVPVAVPCCLYHYGSIAQFEDNYCDAAAISLPD